MSNDTIKDIINDVRDLAATRKNPMTRLALEGIANRLQALCDAGLYITPKAAIDAIAGNGEPGTGNGEAPLPDARCPIPQKRNLVGIICNERSILSWNYENGLAIRVTGAKMSEDVWEVTAWRGDRIAFDGMSHGGKWQAVALVKFLRNGMVSRAMKVKKNHENRRARKAAEAQG